MRKFPSELSGEVRVLRRNLTDVSLAPCQTNQTSVLRKHVKLFSQNSP